MAKRLKHRMSRVMTSLQTCRSKDPSTLPSDPVPSFLRLSSPTHHPSSSSFNRHVSSTAKNTEPSQTPEFKWRKEDNWHVVAKTHHHDDAPRQKISSASGHSSDDHLFPAPAAQKKLRTKPKKKKTAAGGGGGGVRLRLRLSTSSAETGLFSSSSSEAEEEESESETPVSASRSFISTSTDSSASTAPRRPIKTTKRKKKNNNKKKKSSFRGEVVDGEEESPARLSTVLRRMIPCGGGGLGLGEGKVKESYAVVKRSEDPKEDFKRSMAEMVVEKEMVEEGDLEQLLQCFLSLNSRTHQGVIVEAFTEIWEALFSSSSTAAAARRVSCAADKTVAGISIR